MAVQLSYELQPVSLDRVVKRLSRARVTVVGDLLADHYYFARSERVSREAPVLVVRYEREEVRPGGAANVACNAVALGAKVTVVGAVGDDAMGRAIAAQLEAQGVTTVLSRSKEVVTETKLRVLAGGLSTTRQQMIRIDRGADRPLSESLQRRLVRQLREVARTTDVLLVSDYGVGTLGARVRQEVLELRAQGLSVCVDSRTELAAYRGVTLVKPNEPELVQLSGRALRSDLEVASAAHTLREGLAAGLVLVTRGHRGMLLAEEGPSTHHLPVHGSGEAVDVTGAGDTVLAAFGVALAAGASPIEAARLSNVAGSIVVQKEGTATASLDEVKTALRGRLA